MVTGLQSSCFEEAVSYLDSYALAPLTCPRSDHICLIYHKHFYASPKPFFQNCFFCPTYYQPTIAFIPQSTVRYRMQSFFKYQWLKNVGRYKGCWSHPKSSTIYLERLYKVSLWMWHSSFWLYFPGSYFDGAFPFRTHLVCTQLTTFQHTSRLKGFPQPTHTYGGNNFLLRAALVAKFPWSSQYSSQVSGFQGKPHDWPPRA